MSVIILAIILLCGGIAKMSEIKFKLKEMVGFDWNLLDDDQREEVIGHIFKSPLVGVMPDKFGFVKCKKIDENRICGSFTHEHEEEKHRYDDQKEEEKYIDNPFEDFFFILLFDAGLCLLQSRRVRDLSMSMVEERFNETLKRIFGDIGVDFKYLEDISFAVGKDEFIRIFNTENIPSLKVDSLKGRTIPEDFKIFNPEVEKDSMTRAYWADEFTCMDGLFTSANGGGGGLQDSKTSKIALNTGEPFQYSCCLPFQGKYKNEFKYMKSDILYKLFQNDKYIAKLAIILIFLSITTVAFSYVDLNQIVSPNAEDVSSSGGNVSATTSPRLPESCGMNYYIIFFLSISTSFSMVMLAICYLSISQYYFERMKFIRLLSASEELLNERLQKYKSRWEKSGRVRSNH